MLEREQMVFSRPSNVPATAQAWYDSDNTEVRSNVAIQSDMPKLILEKTNTQTIGDGSNQDITFNSTIVDTANGFHTDDVYYVCQQSGYYQIDIVVGLSDEDSKQRDYLVSFMESSDSGSTYAAVMNDGVRYAANEIADSQRQISGLRYLTAGNYYKVKAYYNSTSGAGTFTINTNEIQSSSDNDMDRDGSVTRWSMYRVV